MTEVEAMAYIKGNWKYLIKEGKLQEALNRYFQKYKVPGAEEYKKEEAVEIFTSAVVNG